MGEERTIITFPDDLRQWIDARTLVSCVLEAVQATVQVPDQALPETLPLGRPRMLLTILTYSYAVGLLGSDEIAHQIVVDPELGYLSAKSEPTPSELRHFRRYHRAMLQWSLSHLLERAWKARPDFSLSKCRDQGLIDRAAGQAAEQRINQAVLTDTMALDN